MVQRSELGAPKKAPKQTPMSGFARKIAGANHGDVTMTLALPSGGLSVGDPLTSAPSIALGVPSVEVFLWSFESGGEDDMVIAVRVRKTVAVRWEDADSGGVDSGIFGVWDAGTERADENAGPPEGTLCGPEQIQGRPVFAISTGDGCFACVAGYDAAGELCAIVAGPGVNSRWFGIRPPVDPAKVAALETECSIAAPFQKALLEGAQLATPFAVIADKRKEKARALNRAKIVLDWAISCWSILLADVMPEASRELAATKGPVKKEEMEWAKTLNRIFDYKMSDRRFDFAQRLGGEELVARALGAVDADLPRRLGVLSLAAVWERLDPKHEPMRDAIWYARAGMVGALELHLINGGSTAILAALESPSHVLTRIAAVMK